MLLVDPNRSRKRLQFSFPVVEMQPIRRRKSSAVVAIELPERATEPSDMRKNASRRRLEGPSTTTATGSEGTLSRLVAPHVEATGVSSQDAENAAIGVASDREVAYRARSKGDTAAVCQWASYYSPEQGEVLAPHGEVCNSFAVALGGAVPDWRVTIPEKIPALVQAAKQELHSAGVRLSQPGSEEIGESGAARQQSSPKYETRSHGRRNTSNSTLGTTHALCSFFAAMHPFQTWSPQQLQSVTMLNLAGSGIGDDGVLIICQALRFGPLRSCEHLELLYNNLTWRSALYFAVYLLSHPPASLLDASRVPSRRTSAVGGPGSAAQLASSDFVIPHTEATRGLLSFFFPPASLTRRSSSIRFGGRVNSVIAEMPSNQFVIPLERSVRGELAAPSDDEDDGDVDREVEEDECEDHAIMDLTAAQITQMQSLQSQFGTTDWKNAATSIVSLRLGWNDLRDEGAKILAEMIGKQNFLLEASLSYNEITADGCVAIREALRLTVALFSLDLTGNEMTASTAEQIRGALLYNERQHEILSSLSSTSTL